MNISPQAIEMIKHHEGVRFKPYRCPAKLWTIGVGHVLYPDQGKMPIDQRDSYALRPEDNRTFSAEEVNGILRNDLARYERGVHTLFRVNLSHGLCVSLVSFSFNCGLGTAQRSTLRQKVLRGDQTGAADEFLKYTKGGGKVLPGLVKRRQDERALFLHP
jgi:lysozyme